MSGLLIFSNKCKILDHTIEACKYIHDNVHFSRKSLGRARQLILHQNLFSFLCHETKMLVLPRPILKYSHTSVFAMLANCPFCHKEYINFLPSAIITLNPNRFVSQHNNNHNYSPFSLMSTIPVKDSYFWGILHSREVSPLSVEVGVFVVDAGSRQVGYCVISLVKSSMLQVVQTLLSLNSDAA